MTRVEISIIIPIYNVEDYLSNCLESICRQKFHSFEVILVDDGSKDSSNDICTKFVRRDSRFKLITILNHGQSFARNIGLKHAKGKFISFIDADDMVHPLFLESLYNCLSSDDEIACCKYIDINDFVAPDYSLKDIEARTNIIDLDVFISRMYNGDIGNVVWNKLFKRDLLSGIQFPVGQVHEEVEFFNSIFSKIGHVKVIDLVLYGYRRQREGNTKSTFSVERNKVFPQLLWMLEYLKNNQLDGGLMAATLYTLVFLKDYYNNLLMINTDKNDAQNRVVRYYKNTFKHFYRLSYFIKHPKLSINLFRMYFQIR